MNKSQIFVKAHQITKATIKAGDNYRVTFAIALKIVIADSKLSIADKLLNNGGKEWIKGNMHRIYINADIIAEANGLELHYYKTGNISSAKLKVEEISNSKAFKIMSNITFAKFHYDVKTGEFNSNGLSDSWARKTIDFMTR